MMRAIMFHERNRGAMGVYCKVAGAKAPFGKAMETRFGAVPRCTLVSDQNDVPAGGAKKLAMKRTDPDYA